jgi:HlyD family secretion protein
MRARWLIVLGVVLALGAGAAWWWGRPEPPQFITAPATQGDVVRTIVTTGTVNPVVTVQVGTYVSGVIQSLECDYNTKVKAGQLCAKIDPRPYQVAVDQAKANLAIARAQLLKDQAALTYAKVNYERNLDLRKRGLISPDTLDSFKSVYNQAEAQIKLDEATIQQREAALGAAQVNLDYTNIVSPVDGTVVSRNVNVGQTVAASFQTPTLFLIAKDLTKMQVDTNVSESDVGQARVGEKALFTVEAYPDKTFEGRVSQVRQAPITVQNVVTYNVVINVDNPDLLLLPGMTANARIVTDERTGVLRVPVQALRFDPRGVSEANAAPAPASSGEGRIWMLHDGRPVPVAVSVGLENATWAQITGGGLEAGQPVIVGEASGAARRAQSARSSLRF